MTAQRSVLPQPSVFPEENLVQLLRSRAQEQPDAPMYTFIAHGDGDDVTVTFAQMDQRAREVAALIQARKVPAGQPVMLLLHPGLDYVTAFYGCLYAGAVPVPAYPPVHTRQLGRLQAIINDARTSFALTGRAEMHSIQAMTARTEALSIEQWIVVDDASTCGQPWKAPDLQASDIAFLQYTSGSTSSPKGVMVSHGNLLWNLRLIAQATHSDQHEVTLFWLPPYHDFGLIGGVLSALVYGCHSVLMRPSSFLLSPMRWLKAISDYRATQTGAPNFAYDLCIRSISTEQRATLDLSCLKAMFSGGEPIRAETLERFTRTFSDCGLKPSVWLAAYGLAESTLMVSGRWGQTAGAQPESISLSRHALQQGHVAPCSSKDDPQDCLQLVSTGTIFPLHELVIAHPDSRQRCAPDQVGEVWLAGPCVAQGYWQRELATQDCFHAQLKDEPQASFYMRTGDLGFVRDGQLYICGRHKDLIIINGLNLYPQDIEQIAFSSHSSLRENGAAAFALERQGREQLVVVQELDFGKTAQSDMDAAIANAVLQELGLTPDLIILVKAGRIPRTSSGKIRRFQCREALLDGTLAVLTRWEKPQAGEPPSPAAPGVDEPSRVVFCAGQIQTWLCSQLAARTAMAAQTLDIDQPLAMYGLDSMAAVQLATGLAQWLGRPVAPTVFWEFPTIAKLANHLAEAPTDVPNHVTKAPADEPVAIIGLSCRFPGAKDEHAFWRLLRESQTAIRKAPAERINKGTFEIAPGSLAPTHWAGFIDHIEQFDPQFFGISSLEAEQMDPQQRILMESSWHALEDAGLRPSSLAGSQTGVFIGLSTHDYERRQAHVEGGINVYSATGSAASIAANRLSYFYDFHGPSLTVDSACSSSLVAVHLACQSLRSGDASVALAGAANLILSTESGRPFAQGGMLSPDGQCRTFDAGANGYVRGEGCAVLVLKRLSDAIHEGDTVRAVITGSAVMQDGRSNGLIAPNSHAQAQVIRQALNQAGIAPHQLDYVETHGTGTVLGDPIELNALKDVMADNAHHEKTCVLGSVKANIGHLEAAAGMAGLIKVVLAMQNQAIPGQANYQAPNPHSSLSCSGLKVATDTITWPATEQRYAGISSFGFGGTIAHMVLAPGPEAPISTPSTDDYPQLLLLSAHNRPALQALSDQLADHLHDQPQASMSALAVMLRVHRQRLGWRRAVLCDTREHALSSLHKAVTQSANPHAEPPALAFMFPGQGTQVLRMGQALYRALPGFRRIVEECAEHLQRLSNINLLVALYPDDSVDEDHARHALERTELAQPALFVIEYALARLLMDAGLQPCAMIGHSLGEYVAACISGVFSLEDALRLVATRGALMQALPGGAMLAVSLDEAQLLEYLDGTVSLAAVNGPSRCVVSGTHVAITQLQSRLGEHSVHCQALAVSHAFHSSMMDPLLEAFTAQVAKTTLSPPRIAFVSNLTGTWITDAQATDPVYWARHLREPVRFAAGIENLLTRPDTTLIEVGPGNVLLTLARLQSNPTHSADSQGHALKSTLGHAHAIRGELKIFLETLGDLWVAGHQLDWQTLYGPQPKRRMALPSYPFQHERFWLDAPVADPLERNSLPIEVSLSSPTVDTSPMPETQLAPRLTHDGFQRSLRELIAGLLRMSPDQLDPLAPLIELGADSLVLVQAIRDIEKRWGVNISVRQIFEELTTISAISSYLEQHQPAPSRVEAIPAPLDTRALHNAPVVTDQASESAVERLMARQLEMIERVTREQLETLRNRSAAPAIAPHSAAKTRSVLFSAPAPAPTTYVPYQPVRLTNNVETQPRVSTEQQRFIDDFIDQYTRQTQGSRALAQRYRPVLSDNRASAGFRFSIKELLYPIVSERSAGAYIWDVDGNQYIDLTMGFGVNLFGHRPDFVQQALLDQLQLGFELGPQAKLAGEVAQLVSELTGMPRVTFCNSGTEAVMLALRLARTVTGRKKVVLFSGSYHGWADETLAEADEEHGSAPMAPGIHPGSAAHTIVLEYGSPHALQMLREHAGEIAAVLVEPVQSRRPDLQPREFLHALRTLTREQGITLIFDEIITGFRLDQGGAQTYFDVRADLVTYGKVVGGGMPAGIVAGHARYLDAVDGGQWAYGDRSYPRENTTFFAGTFCKHPLMLVAARAVLQKMRDEGPQLQHQLNQRTASLATRLNGVCTDLNLPINVVHCGSLLRFDTRHNVDLLFYQLVARGLYIWEGRNMFLSTAHSDADLTRIVEIFADSAQVLCDHGFFPGSTPSGGPPPQKLSTDTAPTLEVCTPTLATQSNRAIAFSLSFFGLYDAQFDNRKYQLTIEAGRYADEHGFHALWFPERHFHEFGGLSPNPAVLAAALARETNRIGLRAGSVVLPLQHPMRVAEEWSMVDNLSSGRVGIACASGWHPNDFVLAPEAFADRRELTFERLEQVRTIWRGDKLRAPAGAGHDIDVQLFPMPRQAELPVWITIVGNPDTYRRAGACGAGVLTNLMGQSVDELERNIRLYREARQRHGHDPATGQVTVLLHTFVTPDTETARQQARAPFIRYLKATVGLFQAMAKSLGMDVDVETLSEADREYMLERAYERYVVSNALIGSPESCLPIVRKLHAIGVNEIGCFIDFGLEESTVLSHLHHLDALKQAYNAQSQPTIALTAAQQAIWFTCQYDAAAPAYNVTTVLRLDGTLDRVALEQAFQTVINRHSALRTVFDEHGATQRVLPTGTVALHCVDFTERTDKATAVQAWLSVNAQRNMDLVQGPLSSATLLRTEQQEHFLVLNFHHLVIDGLSQELLFQELAECYSAISLRRTPDLPKAVAFSEYVLQHQQYLKSPQHDRDRQYWMQRFADNVPDPVVLPGTRTRSEPFDMRAAVHQVQLSTERYMRLQEVSRSLGCTLFMSLFGAFAILLHRLTGQHDLVIGIPASTGRDQLADSQLIGYTLNHLPIRCQSLGDLSFSAYLEQVRHSLVAAYTHADYPLSHLMQDLRQPRDADRNPLAPMLFNLNRTLASPSFNGLDAQLLQGSVHAYAADWGVDIIQLPDRLDIEFQYQVEAFEHGAMERVADQFLCLLEHAIEEPNCLIDQLPLMSQAQRMRMLTEWNATTRPYPAQETLHRLFEAQVSRSPDAIAVIFEQTHLTYSELNRQANRLAHHLRGLGVGPDITVAICVERSLEMLVALLGVLKAGGAYVPVDPSYPAQRIVHLLEDSRPVLALTCGNLPQNLTFTNVPCLDMLADQADWADANDTNPSWPASSSSLAYVLFTSGSTGRSKGVAVNHQANINLLWALKEEGAVLPDDVVINVTTLSFDIAGLEIWLPLLVGAQVLLINRAIVGDSQALCETLEKHGVSMMQATPTTWRLLLEWGWPTLPKPLRVLCGGEALPTDLARRLLEHVPAVWNMYGPTETTIWSTFQVLTCAEQPIAIGRPLANTRTYVLDSALNLVPPGVTGELYIAGDGLARGYLNREDLTAAAFLPDPFGQPGARMYRTGDLVRQQDDGTLHYLGRADFQVKIRGFRIETAEIEACLRRCPGVHEAVVLVVTVAGDQRLIACVQPATSAPASAENLQAHAQMTLPGYMLPSSYTLVDHLPQTANGKLDRRALLDQVSHTDTLLRQPYVAPHGATEQALAQLWAHVLGVEQVGRDDNFFALGGHSLLAVQLLGQIRSQFGVTVPLSAILKAPNIKTVAELIEDATWLKADAAMVKIDETTEESGVI